MTEKIENSKIRENSCIAIHTGKQDKAMLPHVVARIPLFTATRAPRERAGQGITIERTNSFGYVIKISTPRRLYCDLDLSVFLSVIALAQRHGINQYELGSRSFFLSVFSISELYELTQTSRKNSIKIYDSLTALGSTNLSITFGERQDQRKQWESKPFWDLEIVSRIGRLGNLLDFNLNRFIVPNSEKHLFADVLKLQELSRPLSKGIFWALLCREHLKCPLEQWKNILGVTETKKSRWEQQSLLPALEELQSIGYRWCKDEKGILVSRKGHKTCT